MMAGEVEPLDLLSFRNRVVLCVDALRMGACIACAAELSTLSVISVTAIEAALRGEGQGCQVDGGVYDHPGHEVLP